MKTGIIVLGRDSCNESENRTVMRCCEYLREHGHRNVFPAFHFGGPRSDDVVREMFLRDGIDTFSILPLAAAEGNMTIWHMPKQIGLPDNSGSWAMIGEHDIAVRFATALGRSARMAKAIMSEIGEPYEGCGALILYKSSELSIARKVADYYTEAVRSIGWTAECCGCPGSAGSLEETVRRLRDEGCSKLTVIPLFVSAGGRQYEDAVRELDGAGAEYVLSPPLSEYREFYEILESKVPEGW